MAVFGWRVPVPGWRVVRCVGGPLPLDPSLSPAPIRLVGCGSWFGSSLCWAVQAVGWWLSCGWQFFSDGVGRACGWLVLLAVFWSGCSQPGVVVAVLVGRLGSAVCLLGVVPWWRALRVVSVSGGCSQACCVVPVGWADLDGRALRRPPLSPPYRTRWSFPDPWIRWGNSHVKTLTDRRSSVSGTRTFRLCRTV